MKKIISIILAIIICIILAGCSKSNPATDFRYKASEESVTIMEYIGNSKTVVIPEKIEGKPVKVISICRSEDIESVTIPSTVTIIYTGAFAGSTSLKEINFGDSVEFIDSRAFYGCTALTEVKLPENLKEIGASAFEGCSSLKKVFLPKSLEKMNMQVFCQCPVEEVELEEGIKKFGSYASFWGANMKELTIPSSVEQIGEFTFHDNLEKVVFEGDAPKTGKQPFGTKATIYYKKGSKGWEETELKEKYKLVAY